MADATKPANTASSRGWLIWACAGLFYLYEMILRASPGTMTTELMRDFGVISTALGVLSSAYYISYVVLQIPCGIIVDRLGTRKVITMSALLCVIGSILFAISESLYLAIIGRFLIGAGSACAFISCLKIGAEWFSPGKFALIAGLTNMMGTLGGMTSGPPFVLLVNLFDWRQATLIAAGFGAALAVLCWMIIREKPQSQPVYHDRLSLQGFLDGLISVVKQPQNWLIAIVGGLLYVPISAFCELWAIPFLMQKYDISKELASQASVMLYFGVAVGSPFAAKLADYWHSYVRVITVSVLGASLLFFSVLYLENVSLVAMFLLLFLIGVFSSGQILCFAAVKENVNHSISGTASGFTNAVVMMSGLIFQPLLGMLLDLGWDGTMNANGTRFYSHNAYHIAILAVPLCIATCMIFLRFIHENFRRYQG